MTNAAHPPRPPRTGDISRWNAARVVLERTHAELVADAGDRVSVPGYAHNYATALLTADDGDGRRGGWVTRGDLVRWADLVVLARTAARLLDPAHTGQHMPECAGCDLRLAVARLREAAVNAGIRGGQLPA